MKMGLALGAAFLLFAQGACALVLGLEPGHYHLTGRLNRVTGLWQLELNPNSSASFTLVLPDQQKFPKGAEYRMLIHKLVSIDIDLETTCFNYCRVKKHGTPNILIHSKDLKTYSGQLSP